MISKDIIRQIRNLEIYTKRLLSGMHVGDYSTAQKGGGFEFDQLNEYQQGDDVRFIDWKGSARSNKILMRRYLEERNRTVLLFVDISRSSFYSSGSMLRYELMAQIAGVIALVGNRGKDHIGLVLFSDKIEKVIAPGRGNPHIHSIMETLFTIESGDSKTDLNVPFSYLASSKKKGVLAFVISDFIGESFEKSLNVARKKYEIVAIRCLDKNEQHFPNVGTLRVKDIESGEFVEIDTGARFGEAISERIKLQNKMFKKHAVDVLNVNVSQSFIADVVKFFRRRMRY